MNGKSKKYHPCLTNSSKPDLQSIIRPLRRFLWRFACRCSSDSPIGSNRNRSIQPFGRTTI